MVSNLSILFMGVSLLICLLVPIGLTMFAYKKYRINLKAVFIGVLVFFVFQFVLRIPLLAWISGQAWYQKLAANALLISLFLGLSAGLFEEVGRFIGFKFFLKRELEWKNGIALGIGHGGIEAILITGIAMVNNMIISFMLNSGTFETLVGSKLPAASAEAVKSTLMNTAPYIFAVGGIERIFAITIQIALSLFILYGIMNRKNIYLLYAILLHAVVDSPLVYLKMKGLGIFTLEGITALMALAALFYIMQSRDIFNRSWASSKVTYIEKP